MTNLYGKFSLLYNCTCYSFLYGKFSYTIARVIYVQQSFYDKFLYDKFSLSYNCTCYTYNKVSTTSFWFSDRHDSYYYPLQQ